MRLYAFTRAVYRRLRGVPLLAPLLDRLRNRLVSGGGNRLLAAATLEQGRQLAGTRDLIEGQALLLDAHAQALRGLQQGAATLAARIARLEDGVAESRQQATRISSLADEVAGLAWTGSLPAMLRQQGERIEFVREEVLFELRKALRLGAPDARPTPVPARIVNHEKLADTGPRRLNLGCGHVPLADMVNVDTRELPGVDLVADVTDLPFAPDSVDEIHAAHLLEHFPRRFAEDVLLPYWLRLLKPGGTLRLVVPDAEAMMEDYRAGTMSFDDLALVTFGGQDYAGDFHYAMFGPEVLQSLLERVGLRAVEVLDRGRKNGLCREMALCGSKPS